MWRSIVVRIKHNNIVKSYNNTKNMDKLKVGDNKNLNKNFDIYYKFINIYSLIFILLK